MAAAKDLLPQSDSYGWPLSRQDVFPALGLTISLFFSIRISMCWLTERMK